MVVQDQMKRRKIKRLALILIGIIVVFMLGGCKDGEEEEALYGPPMPDTMINDSSM